MIAKKQVLYALVAFFVFVSCGKTNDPSDPGSSNGESPYLKITSGTADQTINYDGGSYNVWIESNTDWWCSCSSYGAINMRTDKTSGHGNDVIRIIYDSTRNVTYNQSHICVFVIKWKDKYGSTQSKTINFIRYKNPY